MKLKNVTLAVPLILLIFAGVFITPMTAYANGGESTAEAVEQEEKGASVGDEKAKEAAKEKEAKGAALTPEGNLTLVDDVGETAGTGKQFLTLVTKKGNYFYLIIDRDDKGNSTVHFLNQVDEADLLSLMDSKEAGQMQMERQQPEKTQAVTETPKQEEVKVEEGQPTKSFKLLPLVALVGVLLGGGIAFFVKLKHKKKAEEAKPDPDADYEAEDNDEEDFDFLFDDEEEKLEKDQEMEEKRA